MLLQGRFYYVHINYIYCFHFLVNSLTKFTKVKKKEGNKFLRYGSNYYKKCFFYALLIFFLCFFFLICFLFFIFLLGSFFQKQNCIIHQRIEKKIKECVLQIDPLSLSKTGAVCTGLMWRLQFTRGVVAMATFAD